MRMSEPGHSIVHASAVDQSSRLGPSASPHASGVTNEPGVLDKIDTLTRQPSSALYPLRSRSGWSPVAWPRKKGASSSVSGHSCSQARSSTAARSTPCAGRSRALTPSLNSHVASVGERKSAPSRRSIQDIVSGVASAPSAADDHCPPTAVTYDARPRLPPEMPDIASSDSRRACAYGDGSRHGSVSGPSRSIAHVSTSDVQYAALIPPPDAATRSAGCRPVPFCRATQSAATSAGVRGPASLMSESPAKGPVSDRTS